MLGDVACSSRNENGGHGKNCVGKNCVPKSTVDSPVGLIPYILVSIAVLMFMMSDFKAILREATLRG